MISGVEWARDGDYLLCTKLEVAMQQVDGKVPAMQRINGIELQDAPDGSLRQRLTALEARVRAQDGLSGVPWDRWSDRLVIANLAERIAAIGHAH